MVAFLNKNLSGKQEKNEKRPDLLTLPLDNIAGYFIKQGNLAFHGVAKTRFKLLHVMVSRSLYFIQVHQNYNVYQCTNLGKLIR